MRELKAKVEVVVSVDYNELDSYLNEVFQIPGRKFEFVAVEESGNDSAHTFEVDGKYKERPPTLAEYEDEVIEGWKAGKFQTYTTNKLLEEACRLGYIPAGKYVVEVSW